MVRNKTQNEIDGYCDTFNTLYCQGLQDVEIVNMTGCTQYILQTWRKQNGLQPNRKVNMIDTNHNTFKILYDKGLTDSDIANEVGVSTMTVGKWRKYNKLESNYIKKVESIARANKILVDVMRENKLNSESEAIEFLASKYAE